MPFFTEFKQSFRMALPIMLSNIVQSSSGFVGTVMIAHLGRDSLAAAALGFSVYLVIIVFLFGLFSSTGVLVAHAFGAKNDEGVRSAVSQGLWLAVLMSVPCVLILFFSKRLLYLTGETHTILHLATNYLQALSYGILPLGVLIVFEQFWIGISKARLVLFLSVIEVPLEIFMCYVFIFGRFGFPACGVAGIGYGFASVFFFLVFVSILIVLWSPACRVYRLFSAIGTWHKSYFLESLRVGWPIGFSNIIEVGAVSAIAFFMGRIGSDELAAHQITRQFWVIGMMIVWAIAQVTVVRAGQAVGRNDKPAIYRATYVNSVMGFIFISFFTASYLLFPKFFIGIDIASTDPHRAALLYYATWFLGIASVSMLFDNFRCMFTAALRALKDTRVPMWISLIVFWFLGLPLAYTLAFKFHLGGIGLWLGLALTIFMSVMVLVVRFFWLARKVDLKTLVL